MPLFVGSLTLVVWPLAGDSWNYLLVLNVHDGGCDILLVEFLRDIVIWTVSWRRVYVWVRSIDQTVIRHNRVRYRDEEGQKRETGEIPVSSTFSVSLSLSLRRFSRKSRSWLLSSDNGREIRVVYVCVCQWTSVKQNDKWHTTVKIDTLPHPPLEVVVRPGHTE